MFQTRRREYYPLNAVRLKSVQKIQAVLLQLSIIRLKDLLLRAVSLPRCSHGGSLR